MTVEIPLRSRAGDLVGVALVDEADALQADYRWYRHAAGYAARRIGSTRRPGSHVVLLHREILGLRTGDAMQGDHINGDRLDCRRENLRAITIAEQRQNCIYGGVSQHRGVTYDKRRGRWVAQAGWEGKHVWLGSFAREADAAAAASTFRLDHMPYYNAERAGALPRAPSL